MKQATAASITRIDHRGTPALLLESAGGASAAVALRGAQLLSWQPASGREWMYLSPRADYGRGRAIRGGVPLCFPQFGTLGDLPRHGLVRTADWQVAETRELDGGALVILRWTPDAAAKAVWPVECAVEFSVLLDDERIDLELAVDNTGTEPLSFTAALHAYFSVADVEDVTLGGLRGCFYRDMAHGDQSGEERGDVVVLRGEHDRLYERVPGAVLLREPERALGLHADGFPDMVVWNPGPAKAAALCDLPPDDWRRFVCAEAGVIAAPVTLAAGEAWSGRQTLVDLTHAGDD